MAFFFQCDTQDTLHFSLVVFSSSAAKRNHQEIWTKLRPETFAESLTLTSIMFIEKFD